MADNIILQLSELFNNESIFFFQQRQRARERGVDTIAWSYLSKTQAHPPHKSAVQQQSFWLSINCPTPGTFPPPFFLFHHKEGGGERVDKQTLQAFQMVDIICSVNLALPNPTNQPKTQKCITLLNIAVIMSYLVNL